MSSLWISLIVFACTFGGALLGILLHFKLPDDQMAAETKDVVRLAMGLVATTVALALGLLIGSAKSFFDMQNAEVAQLATNAVSLDRLLAHYGSDANDARRLLRTATSNFSLTLTKSGEASAAPETKGEELLDAIQVLSPQTDRQRFLQNQASSLVIKMGETRWLMYEQRAVPVPVILLTVLVFWLLALFVSFGVFAKPNAMLISGLFASALAVSAAIFLILEMYHPYTGLLQISDEPIRAAVAQLGH